MINNGMRVDVVSVALTGDDRTRKTATAKARSLLKGTGFKPEYYTQAVGTNQTVFVYRKVQVAA
jgi:hypothetical protein